VLSRAEWARKVTFVPQQAHLIAGTVADYLRYPDVLILDEPTSSLDMRSESLIRATLDSLRERMTVIVIVRGTR
jgi:ABC-type multidrug transport system fused ATPase/permease subunit